VVIKVSNPTVPEAQKLTKEGVWGRFDENAGKIIGGMVVARSGDYCSVFGDEVPYKSVTVVCREDQYHEVLYWLEFVHGAESVSGVAGIGDGKLAIRSNYMCW